MAAGPVRHARLATIPCPLTAAGVFDIRTPTLAQCGGDVVDVATTLSQRWRHCGVTDAYGHVRRLYNPSIGGESNAASVVSAWNGFCKPKKECGWYYSDQNIGFLSGNLTSFWGFVLICAVLDDGKKGSLLNGIKSCNIRRLLESRLRASSIAVNWKKGAGKGSRIPSVRHPHAIRTPSVCHLYAIRMPSASLSLASQHISRCAMFKPESAEILSYKPRDQRCFISILNHHKCLS